MKKDKIFNSKIKDSSSKIIFGDAALCSQFLRGYVNIPLLKDVQPEDIVDVLFYLVSLIEHKSQVDYNVVMQILRYIIFIWEDYEREQEREHPGISKTKGFRYPPVLPVIYYDGPEEWTAAQELSERVFLSDVLEEYIPNFKCILVKLKDYSNAELMEKRDELSIVMMINKLQRADDFARIGREVSPEYLEEVTSKSPDYLLDIISQVIKVLLLKINVPFEEAEAFVEQVKERRMGELFANFEEYDVQATRREEREKVEQEVRERDIEKTIRIVKEMTHSKEIAKQQLMEQLMKQYELSEEEAEKKVEMYW